MSSPIIWSGNNSKSLKPNLDLNGNVTILSGSVDPTSVATSANKGSLYLNNSNGNVYKKGDNGSSTDWAALSTGSSNPNDIADTSFAASNNVSVAADVTGFAFANASVRSFDALVSVYVNAATPLYETFKLYGIQKAASWEMSQSSTGDTSGFVFSITTAGQIQYTNSNYLTFTAATVHFRAQVTGV